MNAFICVSSILLFLLGLALLQRERLISGRTQLAVSVLLMAAAVVLRVYLLDYRSADYEDFLAKWVQFFREHGGFAGLGLSVGNYNPPYLYFLALFSYINIDELYLIKLLSVIFDILLAWSCTKLCSLYVRGDRLLICFFAVLMLPTVVLNGAYWGQCDSIYAFFAVMGIYLALSDRPCASMLCAAASLAFKLQAVFILPIYFVLLLAGRIRLRHLFVFPAAYIMYMLPAVIAGRSLWETLTLYVSQAGTVGDALNYNAPSLTSLFSFAGDPDTVSRVLIILAFAFMLLLFVYAAHIRKSLSHRCILCFGILFALGIPYLLPHMHDRYFYIAEMLLICLAFAEPLSFPAVLFAEFASLHCYCAYFARRYFFDPKYGGILMLTSLIIVLLYLLSKKRIKKV